MAKKKANTKRSSASSSATLLLEIGTEELPPKALHRLGESLASGLVSALIKADLVDSATEYRWYATPRRLAVQVPRVNKKQQDQLVERRGPSLSAAYDSDGRPTAAAEGFARSCGVAVSKLGKLETEKGAWLVFRIKQKGVAANSLIPECVQAAIQQLPIPKRMRWADLDAEFVRPVHWLVLLHGNRVVPAKLLAVNSAANTYGHRFHHPKPIKLANAEVYEQSLEKRGWVIPSFSKRRDRIVAQIKRAELRLKGKAGIDPALLDEITGLVEWPQAMVGNIDPEFLQVPAEVLISSMRDHQKYIHLRKRGGRLLPNFITISNIKSSRPSRVRAGNERVLRARLSDARFFWQTDRKIKLESRCERLKDVLFHKSLGSLYDKTRRVRALADRIAEQLGVDRDLATRAAQLAKADLVSDMVGEFPDLQGTMGRYYAEHDGEPPQVCRAIEEHYRPRFAGDDLPGTEVGRVVALAEKIDTVAGLFAAKEIPTGDKDPFGLRRAALGILRIMIEHELDLDVRKLFLVATQLYRDQTGAAQKLATGEDTSASIHDFLIDRMRTYYLASGYSIDEFNAVAKLEPSRPLDFDQRLRAVAAFRKLKAAESLAAANKRIRNILKQAKDTVPQAIDSELLQEGAERALAKKLESASTEVRPLLADGRYEDVLRHLAELRPDVDRFFDDVMVMVDDPKLRQNRLALLKNLGDLFLQVADISRLSG